MNFKINTMTKWRALSLVFTSIICYAAAVPGGKEVISLALGLDLNFLRSFRPKS